MKLLIESAMIFFGTLMAAAVVALGEPGRADRTMGHEPARVQAMNEAPPVPDRPQIGWHE